MTGRKYDIVPVHKKDLKNVLIDYSPIILLPIFATIFEKIILTSIFEYFIENEYFIVCQSGFLPGGSCTSQLLSNKGLVDKLKSYEISGNLLKLFENW